MQTNMYGQYHVDDPNQFFQRDQIWSVAQEPPQTVDPGAAQVTTSSTANGITTTSTRSARFNPYYTMLHVPGEAGREFSLVRPFVPFSENDERKNLIALMAVSSDPATYGQLRVLTIVVPRADRRARDHRLRDQAEVRGRLHPGEPDRLEGAARHAAGASPSAAPCCGCGPWYVQAEQTPIPQLSYVTVAFGDEVFRARTLEGAVKLAFPDSTVDFTSTVGPAGPRRAGTDTGEGSGTDGSEPGSGSESDGGSSTTTPGEPQTVEELLTEANRLYEEARAALEGGRTWPPTRPRSSRPSSWSTRAETARPRRLGRACRHVGHLGPRHHRQHLTRSGRHVEPSSFEPDPATVPGESLAGCQVVDRRERPTRSARSARS